MRCLRGASDIEVERQLDHIPDPKITLVEYPNHLERIYCINSQRKNRDNPILLTPGSSLNLGDRIYADRMTRREFKSVGT